MLAEARTVLPCEPFTLLRPMVEDDRAYICTTWRKSYRNSPDCRRLRHRVYTERQNTVIDECLAKGHVLVAADREDPCSIFGWLCYAPRQALHYLYVKHGRGEGFRGMGVAALLFVAARAEGGFDGAPFTHTHRTKAGDRWIAARGLVTQHVPYAEWAGAADPGRRARMLGDAAYRLGRQVVRAADDPNPLMLQGGASAARGSHAPEAPGSTPGPATVSAGDSSRAERREFPGDAGETPAPRRSPQGPKRVIHNPFADLANIEPEEN